MELVSVQKWAGQYKDVTVSLLSRLKDKGLNKKTTFHYCWLRFGLIQFKFLYQPVNGILFAEFETEIHNKSAHSQAFCQTLQTVQGEKKAKKMKFSHNIWSDMVLRAKSYWLILKQNIEKASKDRERRPRSVGSGLLRRFSLPTTILLVCCSLCFFPFYFQPAALLFCPKGHWSRVTEYGQPLRGEC